MQGAGSNTHYNGPGLSDTPSYGDNRYTLPYENPVMNNVYDLLFCDKLGLYKNEMSIPIYPWDVLFNVQSRADQLLAICDNEEMDSRPRIVGYRILRGTGFPVMNRFLIGVVTEIHHNNGLDVLGVFKDGSARFLYHKEKQIVWETASARSTELVERIMNHGTIALNQVENKCLERNSFPDKGKARISFLCNTGIYCLEGDLGAVRSEEQSREVFKAVVEFMLYLSEEKFRKYANDTKKAVFKRK